MNIKRFFLLRLMAIGLMASASAWAATPANSKFPDVVTLKDGSIIRCVVQKYSAATLTIKIADGKDGVSTTVAMEAVEAMTMAENRPAAPGKEEKEASFADTVVLTGDSTIRCTVKSVSNQKITLLINDGGQGVTVSFPLTGVKSISTAKPLSVEYLTGEALPKAGAFVASNSERLSIKSGVLAAVPNADGRISIGGEEVPAVNLIVAKNAKAGVVDFGESEQKLVFSASVTGTQGNSTSLGTKGTLTYTASGARKNLVNADSIPTWAVQMKAEYNRKIVDDKKSADQGVVSMDYESNAVKEPPFVVIAREKLNALAYTRAEAGFDRKLGIRQYNLAAVGTGLISDEGGIRLRLGLGYRNEDYVDSATLSVGSFSWDVGFKFTRDLWLGKLSNDFTTLLTAPKNFHSLDVLKFTYGKPGDKLTFGPSVTWDYQRQPPAPKNPTDPKLKKLNTTYATEVNYTW